MKTRFFLTIVLAGLLAVSCSKDDLATTIDQPTAERAEAYLTFDIVSGVNSTRSIDGDSSGDPHGDANDSGHSHVGTDGENAVSKILLAFYNTNDETTGGDGLVRVYSVGENQSVGIQKNSDGSYTPSESFLVNSTGLYKIMVVANPPAALEQKSASNSSAAKAIYDEILNGTYSGQVSGLMGENADYFMMANQSEVTVNVTASNNKQNPAKPANAINIERVLAKATYRQTAENNTYKVTADKYTYTIQTEGGWVYQSATDSYKYYSSGFAAATTNEKNINERRSIYVAVIDGTTKYFTNTSSYTGYIGGVETVAKLMVEDTQLASVEGFYPIYTGVKNMTESGTVEYNVQLLEYALVNLNNATYYVRHTGAQNGSPFGTIGNTSFLFDPNSSYKNAEGDFDGTSYFTNPWTSYKNAVATLPFAALPTTDHGAVSNATEATTVGGLLGYIFENGVTAANQTMDKTTSVVFKGQIKDASGNPVTLFKYEDSYYKDLEVLFSAVEGLPGNWTTQQYVDGTIDADDLKGLGISVYENGYCYYAAQIKHFDDGKADTAGPNEFIKMRNNVYSIAVSSVEKFGFSELDMPELENAIEGGDESIYLTLEAKILPWIVRFTNVEF